MTRTPTPAEIETLRKIVNGELDRETDYAAIIAANNTLDRLSPPAPEVDEATVWTRKVYAAVYSACGDTPTGLEVQMGKHDESTGVKAARQALSELIASKDAEIERYRNVAKVNCDLANDCATELAAVSAAIGTTEFMDPPDGGSPTLAEQVARLKISRDECEHQFQEQVERTGKAESELAALRAENERLKANCQGVADALKMECDAKYKWKEAAETLAYTIEETKRKAAERNPAEPVFTDTPSILAERALGQIPAPDTAPVVEVTQVDAVIAQTYADFHSEDGSWNVECAEKLVSVAKRIRNEAEARGRREALEAVHAWALTISNVYAGRAYLITEIERMMTGGK